MKKLLSLFVATMMATVCASAYGWQQNYTGVMLQGFSWDSYDYSQWTVLESQAEDMKGFIDLVWVPQSGRCYESTQVMGYTPYYYFNQNSSFGTEAELRSMIKTFKANGIGTIADVVINHHNTDGYFSFPAETYNGVTYQFQSTDICANDDGGATATQAKSAGVSLSTNNDEGEDWNGCRDLDHKSENVQKIIKAYVKYLKDDLGYTGFRYDMVKGFNGSHVADYNDAAGVEFSVGEYWDGVTAIKNWIDATNKKSAAFDFQFHYRLTDAIKAGNWDKLNTTDQLINNPDYRQYAVTFVENHDIQDRVGGNSSADPIKEAEITAANAYLLAMPGTPCIFQPHWRAYKQELKSMIEARKLAGIHNQSTYSRYAGSTQYYAVQVEGTKGSLIAVVGTQSILNTIPTKTHTKILNANRYAYYLSNKTETAWLDKASGTYTEAFDVTLTAVSETSNAKLVYTLDGTTPTANSQQVESGSKININSSCTLTVGLLINGAVSGIVSHNYTIQAFEPYKIKVYVNVDQVNWNNVNFWAWNSSNTNLTAKGQWPGDAITATETIDGKKWYYQEYTISTEDDVVNLVFSTNTGSPQTVDKTGVKKTSFFEIATTKTGDKYNINDVTANMPTGIGHISVTPKENTDNAWYTLGGMRMESCPSSKGIYIHQGKKIVVR